MVKKEKIKNLFKFLPKSKHRASEGLEEGKYPFYTSSAVLNKYINEYDHKPDKLIFATGGSASVHYANTEFATSADNFILEPNKDINAEFVYYYLKNNIQILQNGFRGAGLQHLSRDYLGEIYIPQPQREEQEKIVSILSKIETIKQKKELSNKKLDEFLKSTFINMFGNMFKNKTSLKPLENVFLLSSGNFLPDSKREKNGNYSVYGANGLIGNHNQYMFKEPKFCIGRVGVKCGCIHITKPFSWITDNALYVKNYKISIDETYLSFALSYINLNQYAKKSAQPQISQTTILKLKIAIPDDNLQKHFSKIAEKVETQKQKNKQIIEQMNNLSGAIAQKTFKKTAS